MKHFLQLFFMTLVIVECFLFFGGYLLFDFSHNYYGAGASCAFLLALLLHGFLSQSSRIDELEKRIQELENDKKQLGNGKTAPSSDHFPDQ